MTKKKYLTVILAIVFALFQTQINAQRLVVSGQKIINSTDNEEVVLNAVNFGNWMVMEGYMMNSASQAPAQHVWKQKLTTLIGSDNTKIFYDAWLTNHVTQEDINQVKAWGFNAVRLPLHYEYFVNLGTPDIWNDQGFVILDNVIAWCKAAGIYAIIDLHAAPGGQSDGAISDYDNTKPSLWASEANKSKTVALWRRLSERYKAEDWVAGYDLLNEPAWNLPGGTALRNIYGRLTDTIRVHGDQHILFIEGNWYANDFTGLTPAWDANMVYAFHKYWSNTTDEDLGWVLNLRAQQNRPIWCGEHGENSNTHFTKTAELLQRNNIGASWWPMKKFQNMSDFADAQWPNGYAALLGYLGGTNPGLSPATAMNTLMQLAENVKLANCTIQNELIRAITTQSGNRDTEPFAANDIPGRIDAPNYDQGVNGYAYSDREWENAQFSTGTYTSWNNGWILRNNGVDLEPCADAQSNGYSVGWFDQDEWMQYTCNVASAGTYAITFRVANGASAGVVQIQNEDGTKILATANVPSTGGWYNWATVSCTGGFSDIGTQKIRIVNAKGVFNVASVNFMYENTTIPATVAVPLVTKVVTLKGNNGKYVAYSGVNNLLSCTSTTVGAFQEFALVDAGNGLHALQGNNGLYVTLNPSDEKLYCNSAAIAAAQQFTVENLNGKYSIQGNNDLFASSEDGSTAGMTCTRTVAGSWEFFNWTVVACIVVPVSAIEVPTSVQVFPNPAQNTLLLHSVAPRTASLVLYDLIGSAVIHTTFVGNHKSIDISGLPKGVYVVQMTEGNRVESVKFIKQ